MSSLVSDAGLHDSIFVDLPEKEFLCHVVCFVENVRIFAFVFKSYEVSYFAEAELYISIMFIFSYKLL